MDEADYKRAIVKMVKANNPDNYARRIEDKFGVGFPDLIVRIDEGPVCFIEAKIIEGASFSPSPRQYIELINLDYGSHSFGIVLGILPRAGKDQVLYYFSEPAQKISVAGMVAATDFIDGLRDHLNKASEGK